MAKKPGIKALQFEINTDNDWNEFLKTPGLLVVEVYSKWSGPCTAMVSTLRKVKIEIAGDLINYAIADNENVTDLERFRFTSEPIWMFIQDQKIVNFMFGANCPELKRLLISEIHRVKNNIKSEYYVDPNERSPEEQIRFEEENAIRQELENKKYEKKRRNIDEKYDAYMNQMNVELCEETMILILPWVFYDENNEPIKKERAAAYSEIKNDLLLECFEIAEECEFQFKVTEESDSKELYTLTEINMEDEHCKEHLKCLYEFKMKIVPEKQMFTVINLDKAFSGKCLILRLKGKPPHPTWPVHYPNKCEDSTKKCPNRAIDDVENYLANIIKDQPPPLISPSVVRRTFDEPFWKRHIFENPENGRKLHAVWTPPNAQVKVELFNIIFLSYMKKHHTYSVPEPPLPLCGFKFRADIFETLRETCVKYTTAINNIGVFQYDKPPLARRLVSSVQGFIENIHVTTGREIMVIIATRENEETFLSFAGIGAYFITESEEEVNEMIQAYFPPDAVDSLAAQVESEEEEDYYTEGYEGEFMVFEDFGYGVIEE